MEMEAVWRLDCSYWSSAWSEFVHCRVRTVLVETEIRFKSMISDLFKKILYCVSYCKFHAVIAFYVLHRNDSKAQTLIISIKPEAHQELLHPEQYAGPRRR